MIEAVVGLLMFINGEIKLRHDYKTRWRCAFEASVRELKDNFLNPYLTNAGRVQQN